MADQLLSVQVSEDTKTASYSLVDSAPLEPGQPVPPPPISRDFRGWPAYHSCFSKEKKFATHYGTYDPDESDDTVDFDPPRRSPVVSPDALRETNGGSVLNENVLPYGQEDEWNLQPFQLLDPSDPDNNIRANVRSDVDAIISRSGYLGQLLNLYDTPDNPGIFTFSSLINRSNVFTGSSYSVSVASDLREDNGFREDFKEAPLSSFRNILLCKLTKGGVTFHVYLFCLLQEYAWNLQPFFPFLWQGVLCAGFNGAAKAYRKCQAFQAASEEDQENYEYHMCTRNLCEVKDGCEETKQKQQGSLQQMPYNVGRMYLLCAMEIISQLASCKPGVGPKNVQHWPECEDPTWGNHAGGNVSEEQGNAWDFMRVRPKMWAARYYNEMFCGLDDERSGSSFKDLVEAAQGITKNWHFVSFGLKFKGALQTPSPSIVSCAVRPNPNHAPHPIPDSDEDDSDVDDMLELDRNDEVRDASTVMVQSMAQVIKGIFCDPVTTDPESVASVHTHIDFAVTLQPVERGTSFLVNANRAKHHIGLILEESQPKVDHTHICIMERMNHGGTINFARHSRIPNVPTRNIYEMEVVDPRPRRRRSEPSSDISDSDDDMAENEEVAAELRNTSLDRTAQFNWKGPQFNSTVLTEAHGRRLPFFTPNDAQQTNDERRAEEKAEEDLLRLLEDKYPDYAYVDPNLDEKKGMDYDEFPLELTMRPKITAYSLCNSNGQIGSAQSGKMPMEFVKNRASPEGYRFSSDVNQRTTFYNSAPIYGAGIDEKEGLSLNRTKFVRIYGPSFRTLCQDEYTHNLQIRVSRARSMLISLFMGQPHDDETRRKFYTKIRDTIWTARPSLKRAARFCHLTDRTTVRIEQTYSFRGVYRPQEVRFVIPKGTNGIQGCFGVCKTKSYAEYVESYLENVSRPLLDTFFDVRYQSAVSALSPGAKTRLVYCLDSMYEFFGSPFRYKPVHDSVKAGCLNEQKPVQVRKQYYTRLTKTDHLLTRMTHGYSPILVPWDATNVVRAKPSSFYTVPHGRLVKMQKGDPHSRRVKYPVLFGSCCAMTKLALFMACNDHEDEETVYREVCEQSGFFQDPDYQKLADMDVRSQKALGLMDSLCRVFWKCYSTVWKENVMKNNRVEEGIVAFDLSHATSESRHYKRIQTVRNLVRNGALTRIEDFFLIVACHSRNVVANKVGWARCPTLHLKELYESELLKIRSLVMSGRSIERRRRFWSLEEVARRMVEMRMDEVQEDDPSNLPIVYYTTPSLQIKLSGDKFLYCTLSRQLLAQRVVVAPVVTQAQRDGLVLDPQVQRNLACIFKKDPFSIIEPYVTGFLTMLLRVWFHLLLEGLKPDGDNPVQLTEINSDFFGQVLDHELGGGRSMRLFFFQKSQITNQMKNLHDKAKLKDVLGRGSIPNSATQYKDRVKRFVNIDGGRHQWEPLALSAGHLLALSRRRNDDAALEPFELYTRNTRIADRIDSYLKLNASNEVDKSIKHASQLVYDHSCITEKYVEYMSLLRAECNRRMVMCTEEGHGDAGSSPIVASARRSAVEAGRRSLQTWILYHAPSINDRTRLGLFKSNGG